MGHFRPINFNHAFLSGWYTQDSRLWSMVVSDWDCRCFPSLRWLLCWWCVSRSGASGSSLHHCWPPWPSMYRGCLQRREEDQTDRRRKEEEDAMCIFLSSVLLQLVAWHRLPQSSNSVVSNGHCREQPGCNIGILAALCTVVGHLGLPSIEGVYSREEEKGGGVLRRIVAQVFLGNSCILCLASFAPVF